MTISHTFNDCAKHVRSYYLEHGPYPIPSDQISNDLLTQDCRKYDLLTYIGDGEMKVSPTAVILFDNEGNPSSREFHEAFRTCLFHDEVLRTLILNYCIGRADPSIPAIKKSLNVRGYKTKEAERIAEICIENHRLANKLNIKLVEIKIR